MQGQINNDDLYDNDETKNIENDHVSNNDTSYLTNSSSPSSWLSSYPQNYNDCSSNNETTLCPIRMNLLHAIQQQGSIGLIRVMGIIVTKPDLTRTTISSFSQDIPKMVKNLEEKEEKEALTFLFDDGTAMVDVIYYNHNDDKIRWQSNFSMGQTIDLVGVLEPLMIDKKDSEIDENKDTSAITTVNNPSASVNDITDSSEKVSYCFVAHIISKVPHPDSESLRFLELLTSDVTPHNNTHNSLLDENIIERNYYYRDNIIFSGDSVVTSKFGLFHQSSNENGNNAVNGKKREGSSIIRINTTDAFRFLKYNDKQNGTSQHDLMMLFGCTTNEERQAVINVLDELQANGEIYKNNANGLYLPL